MVLLHSDALHPFRSDVEEVSSHTSVSAFLHRIVASLVRGRPALLAGPDRYLGSLEVGSIQPLTLPAGHPLPSAVGLSAGIPG